MLFLRAVQVFLEFVKECRKYDIKVPIVPGIMCTCLRCYSVCGKREVAVFLLWLLGLIACVSLLVLKRLQLF